MKQLLALLPALALVVGCSDEGTMVVPDSSLERTIADDGQAVSKFEFDGPTTFEVTITNMTHGQPFSPGVIATHDGSADLFEVGSPASEGVRLIAENGDPATAFAALDGAAGVTEVIATNAPIHRKGGPGPVSLTTVITAEPGDYLSLAVMLICTNDGFVGLDAVKIPNGPQKAVYFPNAYDAGTEDNDGLLASIVDPCGAIGPVALPADGSNNRPATADVISMHPGISGGADLSADAHSWRNQVARVTIQRVK